MIARNQQELDKLQGKEPVVQEVKEAGNTIKEIKELKEQIEEESKNITRDINRLKNELERLEEEKEIYKSQKNESYKGIYEEYNKKIEEIEKELKEKEEKLKETEDKMEKYYQENMDIILRSLTQGRINIEKEINEIEEQIKKKQEEVEKIPYGTEEAFEEVELEDGTKERRAKVHILYEEISKLQSQLKDKQKGKEEIEELIKEVKGEKDKTKTEFNQEQNAEVTKFFHGQGDIPEETRDDTRGNDEYFGFEKTAEKEEKNPLTGPASAGQTEPTPPTPPTPPAGQATPTPPTPPTPPAGQATPTPPTPPTPPAGQTTATPELHINVPILTEKEMKLIKNSFYDIEIGNKGKIWKDGKLCDVSQKLYKQGATLNELLEEGKSEDFEELLKKQNYSKEIYDLIKQSIDFGTPLDFTIINSFNGIRLSLVPKKEKDALIKNYVAKTLNAYCKNENKTDIDKETMEELSKCEEEKNDNIIDIKYNMNDLSKIPFAFGVFKKNLLTGKEKECIAEKARIAEKYYLGTIDGTYKYEASKSFFEKILDKLRGDVTPLLPDINKMKTPDHSVEMGEDDKKANYVLGILKEEAKDSKQNLRDYIKVNVEDLRDSNTGDFETTENKMLYEKLNDMVENGDTQADHEEDR